MKIGIDIDGVLTDIERWQLDYGSKYYYENFKKEIVDYKGFDTAEMFNASQADDNEWWFSGIKEYIQIPARKFAAEIIKKLKDDKNEIYIITARSSEAANSNIMTAEEMKKDVQIWLDKNNICYDKLIFSPENKEIICIENNIDLMIEDKPKNIISIAKYIPVICFHADYNEKCVGDNITTCYSWYDIYSKIIMKKFNKKI